MLRGQTFAGHALSHVGFTGATAAVLLGRRRSGAWCWLTVAGGVGMGLLGERLAHRDVAIGIVLALSLGLGLLFLHFYTAFATQATALLFGNVLAVDAATVWSAAGAGRAEPGRAGGDRPPAAVRQPAAGAGGGEGGVAARCTVLFLAIVALATAECAQIVGVLLVFTPDGRPGRRGAAADRPGRARRGCCRPALALAEAWLGLTLAFYTDWPTSFWISALSAAVYVLCLGVRWRRAPAFAAGLALEPGE